MSIWLSSRINRQKINDMLDMEISDKVWHRTATTVILTFFILLLFVYFWLIVHHGEFLLRGVFFTAVIGVLWYFWMIIYEWVKRKL